MKTTSQEGYHWNMTSTKTIIRIIQLQRRQSNWKQLQLAKLELSLAQLSPSLFLLQSNLLLYLILLLLSKVIIEFISSCSSLFLLFPVEEDICNLFEIWKSFFTVLAWLLAWVLMKRRELSYLGLLAESRKNKVLYFWIFGPGAETWLFFHPRGGSSPIRS